jgi:hypothetical protein
MNVPDTLIIVHKGALGDFLQAWPALHLLRSRFPDRRLIWAGRAAYTIWTDPLGLERAGRDVLRGILRLHAGQGWPQELRDSAVFWFGLQKRPVPSHSRLWFLPGLAPAGYKPPREFYLEQLQSGLRIAGCCDWLSTWRSMFAREVAGRDRQTVLLFPGSGHQAKCWPLERYLELARRLQDRGARIRFILGPAEQERGVGVQKFEHFLCDDLLHLQQHLLQADLVVGNDCGPLHLAGMLGCPSVAIFGPTPAAQWGPLESRILESGASCSPCTRTAHIDCERPSCLQEIDVDRVERECFALLETHSGGSERDFAG